MPSNRLVPLELASPLRNPGSASENFTEFFSCKLVDAKTAVVCSGQDIIPWLDEVNPVDFRTCEFIVAGLERPGAAIC